MSINLDRADEIYAADMLMAETSVTHGTLGIVEIAAFLTRPEVQLTSAQTRSLLADPKLRASYKELKKTLEYAPVPALLAASSGEMSERTFAQGHLRIVPARNGDQVYLRISFLHPDPELSAVLIIENLDNGLEKRILPPQDARGEVLLVLNPASRRDANLLAALRDPKANGSILAMNRTNGQDDPN